MKTSHKRKQLEQKVLPILLGTDLNAYGVAVQFHAAYGIKSLAIGKGRLVFTEKSKIIDVITFADFDQPEIFLKTLLREGARLKQDYEHLILLASNDNYAELAIKHSQKLSEFYHLPFVTEELMEELISKEHFYELCEKHGLAYPQTVVVRKEDAPYEVELPFDFPVIAKPSNSISYFVLDFPGKEKAYYVPDAMRLQEILQLVYDNGYEDAMIVQDYVPGDDTCGLVANAYCDGQGKVRMLSLGKPILEDPTPIYIGNYAAIRDVKEPELAQEFITFLESISYTGMANADFKYDGRDGKYKVFELNLRQGRASNYTMMSGCNLAEALVNDYVEHKQLDTVLDNGQNFLWLSVPPQVAVTLTEDPASKSYAENMIKTKRYSVCYRYKPDLTLKRRLMLAKYDKKLLQRYEKYFVERRNR